MSALNKRAHILPGRAGVPTSPTTHTHTKPGSCVTAFPWSLREPAGRTGSKLALSQNGLLLFSVKGPIGKDQRQTHLPRSLVPRAGRSLVPERSQQVLCAREWDAAWEGGSPKNPDETGLSKNRGGGDFSLRVRLGVGDCREVLTFWDLKQWVSLRVGQGQCADVKTRSEHPQT